MQDYLVRIWVPSKIFSDAGTKFLSEKCKNLSRQLGICHAVSSSCYHQNDGVEAYIKFSKVYVTKPGDSPV